jgi:hypothetical protein
MYKRRAYPAEVTSQTSAKKYQTYHQKQRKQHQVQISFSVLVKTTPHELKAGEKKYKRTQRNDD